MPYGWYTNDFTYNTDAPHAVTSVNRVNFTDEFTYDANGNMTCRKESGVFYKQDYNAENRISAIHKMDGDCATGTAEDSWLYVGACPERSEGTAMVCVSVQRISPAAALLLT